jgi:hypothetical protein
MIQSSNPYVPSSKFLGVSAMSWTRDKVMSQMQQNEYKLRRAHWEGKGGIACCLNIPKPFWQRMEIDKQSYLKVTYLDNKLIVEKLVDGGIIDK